MKDKKMDLGALRECDSLGRVVIPKGLRRRFNIEPGVKLMVGYTDSAITIVPYSEQDDLIAKVKAVCDEVVHATHLPADKRKSAKRYLDAACLAIREAQAQVDVSSTSPEPEQEAPAPAPAKTKKAPRAKPAKPDNKPGKVDKRQEPVAPSSKVEKAKPEPEDAPAAPVAAPAEQTPPPSPAPVAAPAGPCPGRRVESKRYGVGSIVKMEEDKLTVAFPGEDERMFVYPDVFDRGILRYVDETGA